MREPDAILFDLGMVLVTFDWDRAIPRFVARSRAGAAGVRAFLADPAHEAFERGELAPEEFFEWGRRKIGFAGDPVEFRTYWNEIFTEVPETVALVRQLAPHYPLYVLSNTNPWHAAYVEAEFEWLGLFRARFYSCTLGVRKPAPESFARALTGAHVSAEELLFIDDRADNIEAAAAVGVMTFHAPRPSVLLKAAPRLFPALAGTRREHTNLP